MDPGFYTIPFDIILKWMLVGFAITFFLKDFQRHIHKGLMHIQAAWVLAISISIVLLFLLIEGYDLTIISILSIGGGMVLHLLVLTVVTKLYQFFPAKPLIHSKT